MHDPCSFSATQAVVRKRGLKNSGLNRRKLLHFETANFWLLTSVSNEDIKSMKNESLCYAWRASFQLYAGKWLPLSSTKENDRWQSSDLRWSLGLHTWNTILHLAGAPIVQLHESFTSGSHAFGAFYLGTQRCTWYLIIFVASTPLWAIS